MFLFGLNTVFLHPTDRYRLEAYTDSIIANKPLSFYDLSMILFFIEIFRGVFIKHVLVRNDKAKAGNAFSRISIFQFSNLITVKEI